MGWNAFKHMGVSKSKLWKNEWRVDADELHTYPLNDTMDHILTEDCSCKPTTQPVKREDGSVGWQVIHNAKDERV